MVSASSVVVFGVVVVVVVEVDLVVVVVVVACSSHCGSLDRLVVGHLQTRSLKAQPMAIAM